MTNTNPHLLIIVALACEAKAIRQQGQWQRDNAVIKGCQLYHRIDKPMTMIVSGSGKIASALATSWLAAQYLDQPIAMINIGTAGKQQAELGQLFWVNKVVDVATDKMWFPQCQAKHHLFPATLISYDQPQTVYPENSLVDMEAAGFIQAATKWVSIENIAVIKCISDTELTDISTLKADDLFQLMYQQGDHIEMILDALLASIKKQSVIEVVSNDLTPWLESWHFTVTQQHQLKNHLNALALLKPNQAIDINALKDTSNAKAILEYLKTKRIKASGRLYE